MRRIFVAGRYGVLGFTSKSVPMTQVGPLLRHGFREAGQTVGRSISRRRNPAFRLCRVALGEFRSGRRVRHERPTSSGFLPPSVRDARLSDAGCFVSAQWERMQPIQALSFLPRIPIETRPYFGAIPGGRGATTPSVP